MQSVIDPEVINILSGSSAHSIPQRAEQPYEEPEQEQSRWQNVKSLAEIPRYSLRNLEYHKEGG